ncbi:DUF5686 family protein [Roseivirga misakiensis]|uniref:Bacterial surface antigen (D15) domain-containing protein n=1 Tax=Roseivirga misakiensis TaxID=1563681 RepID=A0A1E5SY55_9BACT|nr:DUF5686 family protein [Roseivirga misakiensis]OEK04045.1 hypothetical protein BFP71_11160 [Roseivirga misakiensis]
MRQTNLIQVSLVLTLLITHFSLNAQKVNSNAIHITKKEQSGINPGQLMFNGVVIPEEVKTRSWFIPPLFDLFQYNTIEGFVFNPRISLTQQLSDEKFIAFKPNLRYGFGSEKLLGKVSAIYYYNPLQFESLTINGGNFVEQFDENSTLTPFANSYSTLLSDRNFLKIFESTFLEVSHSFSPLKNIQLSNRVFWGSRNPLRNLEKLDSTKEGYTSNIPLNNELGMVEFDSHKVFYQETEIRWQLGLSYEYRRGAFKSTSQYPAIILNYKSSHDGVFNSSLSYQRISLELEGKINLKTWGIGQFRFEGGDFLSADSLSLIDLTHFQGNRVAYTAYEPGTFQLLDYYSFSTPEGFFRGHYLHKFDQLTHRRGINPFQPFIDVNFLRTSDVSYFELGLGLQGMARPWRIGLYNSWIDGRHDRIEIRFGFIISEL